MPLYLVRPKASLPEDWAVLPPRTLTPAGRQACLHALRLFRGRVDRVLQVIFQVPPHVFAVLGLDAEGKLGRGALRDGFVAL